MTNDTRVLGREEHASGAASLTDIHAEVLRCLPHLRAFARSLASNRELADDLVQDAIVRALTASDQFTPGTNFKAWIFTILRNLYFNELRKRRRMIEPVEGAAVEEHAVRATQESSLDFSDFRHALGKLNPEQREALVLVGASGFSYEEAAQIANCAVGTIKSRVSRARRELTRLLAPVADDTPRPMVKDK